VVKAGDVVKVKVLEVDLKRQRIALSMRLSERPAPTPRPAVAPAGPALPKPAAVDTANSALAEAFARARRK